MVELNVTERALKMRVTKWRNRIARAANALRREGEIGVTIAMELAAFEQAIRDDERARITRHS